MREYNFDNLSRMTSKCSFADLLQSAEGIKFRSFAPGREQGHRLARVGIKEASTRCNRPVQAYGAQFMGKHQNEVEKEKLKLDRLKRKPSRYILAVTKSLTAQNVDELFRLLKPYCQSPDDILDVAAIEQLLDSNETVVRKHYKLWITSTAILQRILNAGVYNRSDSYREDLVRKSRTFVQPNAFAKAQQILKDNHNCIISGPPGVGKTTLAENVVPGVSCSRLRVDSDQRRHT